MPIKIIPKIFITYSFKTIIETLFQNDQSSIISKKGREILSNKNKIKSIENHIKKQSKKNPHGPIIINI